MLGRIAKFLLVLTAVAPIGLTWAFADWRAHGFRQQQLTAGLVAVLLAVLCVLLIVAAHRQLPVSPFTAASVKHNDSEVVGFLVAYLLPLVSTNTGEFDYAVLAFVSGLLGIVVATSESYSFNPLLTLFGFHFYEVESSDGVAYMLITRRHVRRCKDIETVAELTRSVLLDMTKEPLHKSGFPLETGWCAA